MCVSVSRLHYFLIWNVYYDVLGTLILPIKRWDVIFFYFLGEKSPARVAKVPAVAGSRLLFWTLFREGDATGKRLLRIKFTILRDFTKIQIVQFVLCGCELSSVVLHPNENRMSVAIKVVWADAVISTERPVDCPCIILVPQCSASDWSLPVT